MLIINCPRPRPRLLRERPPPRPPSHAAFSQGGSGHAGQGRSTGGGGTGGSAAGGGGGGSIAAGTLCRQSTGVGGKGESLGTDESLIWVIHRYLQASMNLE